MKLSCLDISRNSFGTWNLKSFLCYSVPLTKDTFDSNSFSLLGYSAQYSVQKLWDYIVVFYLKTIKRENC